MVPPASHKISRVSWYSGSWPVKTTVLYGTLTRSGGTFQCLRVVLRSCCQSYNPTRAEAQMVWALPGSLATTTGISVDFSCQATEMFQFAHVPPQCLCVQHWVSRHHSGWVAPFGILGFIAWMQLPPNVSPVSASFIGFMHLGIHLVLCVACSLLRL